MTETTVLYHFWAHPEEPEVYRNVRTPVIMSIATLRAVSDIPIVVLDSSPQEQNWGHYPEKLNFRIERIQCSLEMYKNQIPGWRHLSRIFDVHKWKGPSKIIYVDTDVFFFQNPFPLTGNFEYFCWNGWNSGFFYYDRTTYENKKFYQLFENYTLSAMRSSELLTEMKKNIGYDAWYMIWDEMILQYMKKKHPDLFDIIPREEHLTAELLPHAKFDEAKIFHANGSLYKDPVTDKEHVRGLFCLLFEEFYQLISNILSDNELKDIFGEQRMEFFNKNRISLFRMTPFLKKVKQPDGHYRLDQLSSKLAVPMV